MEGYQREYSIKAGRLSTTIIFMNYTDRQGTDKKHRETGKKERKKNKTKNGDWNTSTTDR